MCYFKIQVFVYTRVYENTYFNLHLIRSLRWTIRFLRNIKDALEIAFGRIPGYFTSAFKIKEHPDHTIGHMTTEVSEKKQDKVPHVHHTRGGHKKHDKVPAFDHAGHVTVESNGNLGHGKQDEVPTHVLVQEWKVRTSITINILRVLSNLLYNNSSIMV